MCSQHVLQHKQTPHLPPHPPPATHTHTHTHTHVTQTKNTGQKKNEHSMKEYKIGLFSWYFLFRIFKIIFLFLLINVI